jgi:hypothetical protein
MTRFVGCVLALVLFAYVGNAFSQEKVDFEARGRAFVTAIFSDDGAGAVAMMNDQMKEKMGAAGVQQVHAQLTQQVGAFKSITAVHVEQGPQDYQFSIVACEFEKSSLGLRVVLQPDGKVAGLQIVPPGR